MEKEFKECANCGMPIPTSAKICPYCKSEQPSSSGGYCSIVLGIVVMIIIGAWIGGDSDDDVYNNNKIEEITIGTSSIESQFTNQNYLENTDDKHENGDSTLKEKEELINEDIGQHKHEQKKIERELRNAEKSLQQNDEQIEVTQGNTSALEIVTEVNDSISKKDLRKEKRQKRKEERQIRKQTKETIPNE